MDLNAELDGSLWPPKTSMLASAALHAHTTEPNKATPSRVHKENNAEPGMVHFACANPAHSAVAAVGMMLLHHRIGWNHIPKTENGTPDNDTFMATVAAWMRIASQCPPQLVLETLHRAGLQSQEFSKGCRNTLNTLLHKELSQHRPVLALTRGDPAQADPHVVWRVLYHLNPHNNSVHTHNPFNAEQRLVWDFEEWLYKLTGQTSETHTNFNSTLNYTILTACKPSQPRLFVAQGGHC